ncbi:hypothetical protein FA13DRAFT_1746237 [Coprinellus micaceus]|uniref:G domain-containing protein n=1 Tax=Coprinellus micaceus TaxID=71717 RepID=A0A4Y7SA54_COPMI|nr:hypothetical protein FA13DRAFT_1746237 [Coprinellus micaceus]
MPPHPLTFFPSDIVILVTGLVGSGRSTFINALLQESSQKMRVGDPGSLSTCTKKVDCAVIDLSTSSRWKKDYRIILVDTPGFNDCDRSDSSVLHDITTWLQKSFPEGGHRGGVIYLHDISADRIQAAADSDLQALDFAFNSERASKRLVIATTKWNCINNAEANRRHDILKDHWKTLSASSTIHKFNETADAWNIISDFLPQLERGSPISMSRELSGMKEKKDKGERSHGSKREVAFRSLARLFSRFLTNA